MNELACRIKGKVCHETRGAALRAAEVETRLRQVELEVYRCKLCRFWHLTRTPAERRRQAALRAEESTGAVPPTGRQARRARLDSSRGPVSSRRGRLRPTPAHRAALNRARDEDE